MKVAREISPYFDLEKAIPGKGFANRIQLGAEEYFNFTINEWDDLDDFFLFLRSKGIFWLFRNAKKLKKFILYVFTSAS
jgi:hypothetical protein